LPELDMNNHAPGDCQLHVWVLQKLDTEEVIPQIKLRVNLQVGLTQSRNLNKSTPKDEYPIPIADMLINIAWRHQVISFLDSNAGYNQIFMVEEDIIKMVF
jgi:hypothetical protein